MVKALLTVLEVDISRRQCVFLRSFLKLLYRRQLHPSFLQGKASVNDADLIGLATFRGAFVPPQFFSSDRGSFDLLFILVVTRRIEIFFKLSNPSAPRLSSVRSCGKNAGIDGESIKRMAFLLRNRSQSRRCWNGKTGPAAKFKKDTRDHFWFMALKVYIYISCDILIHMQYTKKSW